MEKRGWPDKKRDPALSRTLPHSIEAEQGVLGSMLISPREVIGECVEKINSEYFYIPAHQTIYTIMVEIWRAGQGIDFITFTQILRDRNLLETVGGAGKVTSLFTFVPTASNIGYYLEIVRDKYILREMIAAGTEYVRRAFEEQDEVYNLLDDFERAALAVRPREQKMRRPLSEVVMDSVERIEKAYENKGTVSGLSTGLYELDRITGGLQSSDMIVVAARPSMGKTALGMNIAEHVAINEKLPVLVFSLEMSEQQLMDRLLCSRARVNLQKLRDGYLAERDFPAITAAASRIAESKLFIDDEKITSDTLVARARRMKAEHNIALVVVDYLQLLRKTGFKVSERQAEVSAISGDLKGLAKELRVPVLVMAQLNRKPEDRAGGKPRLSDLRESGAIEQDGDVIGLLTRPEVYAENDEERYERAGEAELIIAKQRNGPIGEIPLTFLKEFTRFEDRARNIEI